MLKFSLVAGSLVKRGSALVHVDAEGRGPTQRALARERNSWEGRDVILDTEPRHPNVSILWKKASSWDWIIGGLLESP